MKRLRLLLILLGAMLLAVGVARAAELVWPAATWQNLSSTEYISGASIAVDASSEGEVLVAWTRKDEDVIYWRQRSPGGSWDASPTALAAGMFSWAPSVVYSDTTPYIAWVSADSAAVIPNQTPLSVYEQTLDSVATPHVVITNVYGLQLEVLPDMMLGDEGLHMAFSATGVFGDGQHDIYYAFRPFGSDTWHPTVAVTSTQVTTATNGWIWRPHIAVDGNTVHIVWHQEIDISGERFHSAWYVSGLQSGTSVTWDEPVRISPESQEFAENPDVAVDASGRVHIVWSEVVEKTLPERNQHFLYYIREHEGSWTTMTQLDPLTVYLNENTPSRLVSRIAAQGDSVVAIWHGYHADSPTALEELFVRWSLDGGEEWNQVFNATDTPDSSSILPNLVWGTAGRIHFASVEVQEVGNLNSYDVFYGRGSSHATIVFLPVVLRGY